MGEIAVQSCPADTPQVRSLDWGDGVHVGMPLTRKTTLGKHAKNRRTSSCRTRCFPSGEWALTKHSKGWWLAKMNRRSEALVQTSLPD